MDIVTPRILISSFAPQSGISHVAVGLSLALQKRKSSVSPVVVGSNLSDVSLLSRLTRRFVLSVDKRLLTPQQIEDSLYRASFGADLILGVGKGASLASDGSSQDYELCRSFKIPLVMVVDVTRFDSAVEAILRGLGDSIPAGVRLGGVILNRVPSGKAGTFQDITSPIPILGVIEEGSYNNEIVPTELSAYDHAARPVSRNFLVAMAEQFEQGVKLDHLMALAAEALPYTRTQESLNVQARQVRIAVADDGCFSFGYRDNLDLLRFYGAELLSFSPLSDVTLPTRIQGVFLPGGNVHEYGVHLSQNQEILHALYSFYRNGGVVISEGSSTALLCEQYQLSPRAEPLEGARILPGLARYQPGFPKRGIGRCIEESHFMEVGSVLRGLTTEEWSLEHRGGIWSMLEAVLDDGRTVAEGFAASEDMLASFGYFHFGSNPNVPRRIVERCVARKASA